MTITLQKKMKRAEAGLCINCGEKPCKCQTSRHLPNRSRYKRGKRKFGRNDAKHIPKRYFFGIPKELR